MKLNQLAYFKKELRDAKERLARVEFAEKHLPRLNPLLVSELKKQRKDEVKNWEREVRNWEKRVKEEMERNQ